MTNVNKKNLLKDYNKIFEDYLSSSIKCGVEKWLIDTFGNTKCPKGCSVKKMIENPEIKPEDIIWTDYESEYKESLYLKISSERALRTIEELLKVLGISLILDDNGFATDVIETKGDA